MTQNDPEEYWTPTVVRYKNGKQAWSTPVGGKSVTFNMFPDTKFRANKGSLDGDLKFGGNGTYAAFFRAEYYGGSAAGHGGDSIVYLDDEGSRIDGKYSQTQHCGHNFGIALSTSDEIPFAAVCTADDGNISIASSKADNMPTIGKTHPEEMFAAEAFGGTRASYSDMVRMGSAENYLLAWVSRPGGGSDHDTRIVRVAQMSAKDTVGQGPNDVTQHDDKIDRVNARIAAIDDSRALLTWEENDISTCGSDFNGYGCGKSNYTGTKFQIVNASGSNQGSVFSSTDVFVSGDIAKVGSNLCWPYVNMKWNSGTDDSWAFGGTDKAAASTVKKLSFACYAPEGLADSSSNSSSVVLATAGSDKKADSEPSVTGTEQQSTTVLSTQVSDPTDQPSATIENAAPNLTSIEWASVSQYSVEPVPTTFVTVTGSWSGTRKPPPGGWMEYHH